MRVTPTCSQRRAPLTHFAEQRHARSAAAGRPDRPAARSACSYCGGILAAIHMTTSATRCWPAARRSRSTLSPDALYKVIRPDQQQRGERRQQRADRCARPRKREQAANHARRRSSPRASRLGAAAPCRAGSSRAPRARSALRSMPPWPPFSTRTASAIFGLSAGAKAMNSAWSRWRSLHAASRRTSRSASCATTCAVPVLPAIVYCAPAPAPRAGAARACRRPTMASRTNSMFSGLQRDRADAAAARCWSACWSGCPGCGCTRCGRNIAPLLAMVATACASCSGVASIVALADADRDRVAGVPLLLAGKRLLFHSCEGSSPPTSPSMSMPVRRAETELADEVVDGVDAQIVREHVVVRVAGDHDRLVHVDHAVAAGLPVAVAWPPPPPSMK